MDVPTATAAPTLDPTTGVPHLPGPAAGNATTATQAVTSAPASSGPAPTPHSNATLSPLVAKLFNAAEANVTVSFQVSTNPDEVVTVFTDKSTGKEIVQFPSQALIALAQMYDKDAGKVLDKSA